jgi:hypothetical protein
LLFSMKKSTARIYSASAIVGIPTIYSQGTSRRHLQQGEMVAN